MQKALIRDDCRNLDQCLFQKAIVVVLICHPDQSRQIICIVIDSPNLLIGERFSFREKRNQVFDGLQDGSSGFWLIVPKIDPNTFCKDRVLNQVVKVFDAAIGRIVTAVLCIIVIFR